MNSVVKINEHSGSSWGIIGLTFLESFIEVLHKHNFYKFSNISATFSINEYLVCYRYDPSFHWNQERSLFSSNWAWWNFLKSLHNVLDVKNFILMSILLFLILDFHLNSMIIWMLCHWPQLTVQLMVKVAQLFTVLREHMAVTSMSTLIGESQMNLRIWACASQVQWHNELARWMSSIEPLHALDKGQVFSEFVFFWFEQEQSRLTRQLWPFCCIFHSTSGLETRQFVQNSKCKAQGCSFPVPDQVSCWSREILSLIWHRPATSASTAISFRLCCGDVWTKTENSC